MKLHLPLSLRSALLAACLICGTSHSAALDLTSDLSYAPSDAKISSTCHVNKCVEGDKALYVYDIIYGWNSDHNQILSATEVPVNIDLDGQNRSYSYTADMGQEAAWIMTTDKHGAITMTGMDRVSVVGASQLVGSNPMKGVIVSTSLLGTKNRDSCLDLTVTDSNSFSFSEGVAGTHGSLSYGGNVEFDNVGKLTFSDNQGVLLESAHFSARNINQAVFSGNTDSVFKEGTAAFSTGDDVRFEGNQGPIFLRPADSVTFTDCPLIVFDGNTGADGVISYGGNGNLIFNGCGSVKFNGNIASQKRLFADFMPLFVNCDTVFFTNNESQQGEVITRDLSFDGITGGVYLNNNTATCGEKATLYGGGMLVTGNNAGNITATGNADAWADAFEIKDNVGTGKFISGLVGQTIDLNWFNSVSFDNNRIISNQGLKRIIGTVDLSNVGTLSVSDNVGEAASTLGGVFSGASSLENVATIKINNNELTGVKSMYPLLGALTVVNAQEMEVVDNTIKGWAVEGDRNALTLNNVVSFTYTGNQFLSEKSGASSGLVHGATFDGIETWVASGNASIATNGTAYAGAFGATMNIQTSGAQGFYLKNSGSVTLSNNHAIGDRAAFGGAVFATSNVEICSNNQVSVTGNYAKASAIADLSTKEARKSYLNNYSGGYTSAENYGNGAWGGAIYLGPDSQGGKRLRIYNNSGFVSRGNYVTDGTTYYLQGVVMGYGNVGVSGIRTLLAAPLGKKVELYDSAYFGGDLEIGCSSADITDFPKQYTEEMRNKGTVVFSGKYARNDLEAIKSAAGAGAVTQEELEASATFKVEGNLRLNGNLQVDDGAKLVADIVYFEDDANLLLRNSDLVTNSELEISEGAHVVLDGGTMSFAESKDSYFHYIGDTGVLEVKSPSTIVTNCMSIVDGGTLGLTVASENKDIACLTLQFSGKFWSGMFPSGLAVGTSVFNEPMGTANLALNMRGNLTAGDYILITCTGNNYGVYMNNDWTKGESVTGLHEGDTLMWQHVEETDEGRRYDLVWHISNDQVEPVRDATTLTWTGDAGTWRADEGAEFWTAEVEDTNFRNGDSVIFAGAAEVTLSGVVTPADVLVGNEEGSVILSSANNGQIAGGTKLTKEGAGELQLNLANAYTGGTVLKEGVLVAGHASALGLGDVRLEGGTLEIAADGIGNAIVVGGETAALVVRDGCTLALGEAIRNSGTLTLSGAIDASALELETTAATHVDTEGRQGASGFAKAESYRVALTDGGSTVDAGASVTHGDIALALGTDGAASSGGEVDYGSYLLTGTDAASTSAIHSISQNAAISMDGGTLTADDDSAVEATGGTILLQGGTLSGTLSGTDILVSGGGIAAAFSGENALTVQDDHTLALSETLRNSGTLTLGGAIDASALELETTAATHVDTEGRSGASGFAKAESHRVVLTDGGSTVDAGASVTHGSIALTLGTDGAASSGGEVDYGSYLLTGTDAASTSAIHAITEGASVRMDGGTLSADDDSSVEATGGSILLQGGTLSGTLSGTDILVSGGGIAAAFSGENALTVQDGHTLALSETLRNSGTLTLSGAIDASALELETTVTGYVDIHGNVGENGFAQDADHRLVLAEGGTVADAGAVITHSGHTLTLNADGTATGHDDIDHAAYRLTDDGEAATSAIHTISQNAAISMDGGTLTADDDSTVHATGGSILLQNGTLSGTLDGTDILVSGGGIAAAFSGENVLTVQDGHTLALTETLRNSGTLNLGGAIDVSALELETTAATHVDTEGRQGASGFAKAESYRLVLTDGGSTVDAGASVTHGDIALALGTDGTASGGGEVDYGSYLLTGTDTASTSAIHAVAEGASIRMDGGTLTADDDSTVHATGGSILLQNGTLTGTTHDADIRIAEGTLDAAVGGSGSIVVTGTATISGANSHTGGTVIDGGTLSATHSRALGAGATTLRNATRSRALGAGATILRDGTLHADCAGLAGDITVQGLSTMTGMQNFVGSLKLTRGSRLNAQGTYSLAAGRTLTVAAGGCTYNGDLELAGGTLVMQGASLTVTGTAVFAEGSVTTLDFSQWKGGTLRDGMLLADFGGSAGYTEGCLTLSGLEVEAGLGFDQESGSLTLILPGGIIIPGGAEAMAAALGRNQRAAYNALVDIAKEGEAQGVLGELAKAVTGSDNTAEVGALLDRVDGATYATAMASQIDGNLAHLRRLRSNIGTGQAVDGKGDVRAYVVAYNDDHTMSADASGSGYRRTEWGAALGAERNVGERSLIGISTGAGRASVSPTGDSRYHEDTVHADLYLVLNSESGWQGVTTIGFGAHSYSFNRALPGGGQAESQGMDGVSLNFSQEISCTIPAGERSVLQPFFAVQSSVNSIDSFDETGAGSASLKGGSRDAWATDLILGARYSHSFGAGQAGAATLDLQAGLAASVGDTTADLDLHYAGAPSHGFSVSSARRNRWGYNFGATLTVPVTQDCDIFGSAGALLRGDSSEASFQTGVRCTF